MMKIDETSHFLEQNDTTQDTNSPVKGTFLQIKYEFDDAFILSVADAMAILESKINEASIELTGLQEIVSVHKARSISNATYHFLSSNSRYIKSGEKDGTIRPSEVIDQRNDIDFATYENRFLHSLIKRLLLVVQKRLVYYKQLPDEGESQILTLRRTFIEAGSRTEITFHVRRNNYASQNKENVIRRLETLQQQLVNLFESGLMRLLHNSQEVFSPVHQTNLIAADEGYQRLLLLWNSMEQDSSLGVCINRNKGDLVIDEKTVSSLKTLSVQCMNSVNCSRLAPMESPAESFSPETIFALEDETFDDGAFLYSHLKPLGQRNEDSVEAIVEKRKLIQLQEKEKTRIHQSIAESRLSQLRRASEARSKILEKQHRKREKETKRKHIKLLQEPLGDSNGPG